EGTNGVITISNQNLDLEKKLYESPFAASTNVERLNGKRVMYIDLHDGVQGDLNALKFTLAGLETGVLDSKFKAHIQLLQSTLQQTTENVRVISQKLMPPLLDQKGLRPALEVYF
ncbi:MAG: hypothetical protein ACKO96_29380, partial [Flammeovirgaceae bacterium]